MKKHLLSSVTFMLCMAMAQTSFANGMPALPPLPDLPPLPAATNTVANAGSSAVSQASQLSQSVPPNPTVLPELKLPELPSSPPPQLAVAKPSVPSVPSFPPLPTAPSLPTVTGNALNSAGDKSASATPGDVLEQAPQTETLATSKKKKHKVAKHHGSSTVAVADSRATAARIRPNYYISEPLPQAIYRKSYDYNNRHLPVAMYEQDYDRMVFKTAARDDIDGLRGLLDNGRNVELMDVAGDTPLLVAVKHNAINTARLLLARHANPQVVDRRGRTPLQIAASLHNYPMQRALEEMGATTYQQMSSSQ